LERLVTWTPSELSKLSVAKSSVIAKWCQISDVQNVRILTNFIRGGRKIWNSNCIQKPKCTRDEAHACHDYKSHILQEIKYTLCTWNVHLPINLYRVLREREEKKRREKMRKKKRKKEREREKHVLTYWVRKYLS